MLFGEDLEFTLIFICDNDLNRLPFSPGNVTVFYG